MPDFAAVRIHESQFPQRVRNALAQSLRAGEINHKFHYDSVKQTQKWLALHQRYAPSRNDPDCIDDYARAFAAASKWIRDESVTLIGLGCGGGQKDSRLLAQLRHDQHLPHYVPLDVSSAMTLVARNAALNVLKPEECTPCVADLLELNDLGGLLDGLPASARLITFFGMLPNFEPEIAFPLLRRLTRPDDVVLVSANLAPGSNYSAGVLRVLPQYYNPLTAEWLLTFLLDLGIERGDGTLAFQIEETKGLVELQRIVARYVFDRARTISLDEETFVFEPGRSIRLFFSYRYTEEKLQMYLDRRGFSILERWIVPSGEEGIFLARRNSIL